ncbi:hypothetical protein [Cellulomonas sp. ICMP 17802]|uniref:hypothetical protein n=1 Tax=Cellulomonas sp. ICMP 17802 TaxID=3239199 RepID=UPI00351B8685
MRVRLTVAVAAALLLVGSSAAYGAWSRTITLGSAATLRAGTMGLSATWTTAPTLSGLLPGTTRSGIAKLTHSGNGRWQYMLPSVTGAETMPGLAITYTSTTGAPGTCGATAIPADAWSATQPAGSTVYVCVTATLAATAPSSAQSVTPAVAITVKAQNQSTK